MHSGTTGTAGESVWGDLPGAGGGLDNRQEDPPAPPPPPQGHGEDQEWCLPLRAAQTGKNIQGPRVHLTLLLLSMKMSF